MPSFTLSWRTAVGAVLAATAITALMVALADGSVSTVAKASSVSVSAIYPALDSKDASGMTLFATPHRHQPGSSAAPGFPMNPPAEPGAAEHWPIASTIRRVAVDVPGVVAWIAESYGGGVCVLAWDGSSDGAVGFSCSTAAKVDQGAGVELREMPSLPGKVLKVGVVPSGTKGMTAKLTNGSTVTIPVAGNAWAYLADEGSVVPESTTALGS
jgi:hypothetical protein